ncbi:hypothetical protein CPCC7001_327 [Cyanobium sp. PCC 7001]|uniref:hypothetical protein n=1 Tax=Cyanobium sp. PCC 7001 TaxID=180281 RepID=UPI0001804B2D|nr:hypothetical protein [Cyanobium sp. PCC 7001]EDY37449.1 hypothetical protein CPCC7001_327 [Cyanobium sp. PCC 7001]
MAAATLTRPTPRQLARQVQHACVLQIPTTAECCCTFVDRLLYMLHMADAARVVERIVDKTPRWSMICRASGHRQRWPAVQVTRSGDAVTFELLADPAATAKP